MLLFAFSLVFTVLVNELPAAEPEIIGDKMNLSLTRSFFKSLEQGKLPPASFHFVLTSRNQLSDGPRTIRFVGVSEYSYPSLRIQYSEVDADMQEQTDQKTPDSAKEKYSIEYFVVNGIATIHDRKLKRVTSFPVKEYQAELPMKVVPWDLWCEARPGLRFSKYLDFDSLPPGHLKSVEIKQGEGGIVSIIKHFANTNVASEIQCDMNAGGAIISLVSDQPKFTASTECEWSVNKSGIFLKKWLYSRHNQGELTSQISLEITKVEPQSWSPQDKRFRPSLSTLEKGTYVSVLDSSNRETRSYFVGGRDDPTLSSQLLEQADELKSTFDEKAAP